MAGSLHVFDESQLNENGDAPPKSHNELWAIDAVEMEEVVCRVVLPQRMPYGMHGNWSSEEQIVNQRDVRRFRTE